jgi:hypothetical protein
MKGEQEIMRLAMDSAYWPTRRFKIATFACATAVWLMSSGCAGWSSMGETRGSLLGQFWNRPSTPVETPGYDLYAESMAARAPAAKPASSPGGATIPDQTPKDKTKQGAASPSAGNDEKPASTLSMARGRGTGRSADTSLRVTLGRPETLPTLKDLGTPGGPALAMGAKTNWHRPDEDREPRTDQVAYRAPERTTHGAGAHGEGEAEKPNSAAGRKPASASSEDTLRALMAKAKSRLEAMSTYQVKITRVERVGGQLQAEEEALLSIRRNPRAVRLEWVDGPSKGREVIYSSAVNDRMMYVNMGNSALPISRMSIPVDSPLALRNSRHPITEAGFDTIFQNLAARETPQTATSPGTGKLEYKGIKQPKGADQDCHLLERVSPQGETWQVYLDTKTLMPAVVVAFRSSGGELIERYTYKNLKANLSVLADVAAFDPDKRWGESRSWLSRLARTAATPAEAGGSQTTTR